MPLNDEIADSDYEVLAADLLEDPKYSQKLIIACWHHSGIPDLALALKVPQTEINNKQGMDGMHWQGDVFNLFWSIKFTAGVANLTISLQPAVPAVS